MDLYIHFGIYKAGSSYLQYTLANSRTYLEQQRIYFPNSKEDSKMYRGFISKGNADGLEKALKNKNVNACLKILRCWKNEAEEKECDKVLISSEALVHQLAINERLDILMNASKKANYRSIHTMGFFRDLVDHALSTYKHRAKSGNIPNFTNWITNVYETPTLLENLAKCRSKYIDINWTFRKFHKNSNFLKKAFFNDWLKIEVPVFLGKRTVNESLTISEIFLIQSLRNKYNLVIDYFVEDLKRIPKIEKGVDKILENHIYSVFRRVLLTRFKGIEQINQFLSEEEKMDLGNLKNINEISEYDKEMILTKKQVEIIVKKIYFFSTLKGRLIFLKRKIRLIFPNWFLKKLLSFKYVHFSNL